MSKQSWPNCGLADKKSEELSNIGLHLQIRKRVAKFVLTFGKIEKLAGQVRSALVRKTSNPNLLTGQAAYAPTVSVNQTISFRSEGGRVLACFRVLPESV